jgi:adenylosuccinate synthase
VIGNGVVIDPQGADRGARRAAPPRRSTSAACASRQRAPDHALPPAARPRRRGQLGKLEIGTTRRGIGPCYADKAARLGIRVQDLLDEKILKKKIAAALYPKQLSLRPFAKDPRLDLQSMTEEYLIYGHRLEQYIADTSKLAWSCSTPGAACCSRARRVRCSTSTTARIRSSPSSNPVAGAACVGAGVGPRDIDEIWGVAKAYVTRVGAGPLPTEDDPDLADELRAAAASSAPPPAAPAASAGSTSSPCATPRA